MKKVKRRQNKSKKSKNPKHWLEAKRINTAPKQAQIEALYALTAALTPDDIDKHYKLSSSINTLSKSLREDLSHNLKIDRELVAMREADKNNPNEKELDRRRQRLISELCGIANNLSVDDYDPDKLAAVIEAEEREARNG